MMLNNNKVKNIKCVRLSTPGITNALIIIFGFGFGFCIYRLSLSLFNLIILEKQFTTISNDLSIPENSFTPYTVLFDQSRGMGTNYDMSSSDYLLTLEASLSSAVNLSSPLTIVTHSSVSIMPQLERWLRKYPHLRLYSIPDEKIDELQSMHWVTLVDTLKLMFMEANHDNQLFYCELDMLFLPKAGEHIARVFNTKDFDVAFTYEDKRGVFGSTNTGVVFLRASNSVISFHQSMLNVLLSKDQSTMIGGDNQLVIDMFVTEHLREGETFRVSLAERSSVLIYALQRHGPFNYSPGSCTVPIPEDIFILHFNGKEQKNIMRDKACQLLVFPSRVEDEVLIEKYT